MTRVDDKIEEIEKFIEQLKSFLPPDFDDYESDFQTKAACERYCEKIIEAVVDIAFLMIKELKLKIPEEDKEAFIILADKQIISSNLSAKLQDAKGMRNILAHEYGKVDDNIVFHAVTEELENDVREFLENVKTYLQKKEQEKNE